MWSLSQENEQTSMLDRLAQDISNIPTLNTRVTYLTNFRKAARKRLSVDAPKILEKLKLPKSLWTKRKETKAKHLKEKQKSVVILKDPQALVNIATNLLGSAQNKLANRGRFRDLMVALALLTGRRSIEIAKVGSIYDDPSQCSSQELMFTGQAKAKREVAPYKIPVLGDKFLALKAWKQLRELKPKWATTENSAITRGINKSINEAAKDAFEDIAKTFKDLRAMYAAICYDRFAKNGAMTVSAYASSILGHWEDDNTVGLHYGGFKVWQPESSSSSSSSSS
jgi:hypothetical protein